MAQQVSQSAPAVRPPTAADLVDRLSRFDGPPGAVPGQSAGGAVPPGRGGHRRDSSHRRSAGSAGDPGGVSAAAPGAALPVWAAQASSRSEVTKSGIDHGPPRLHADDMYGQEAKTLMILVPLKGGQGVRGVAPTCWPIAAAPAIEQGRERLELTASLLSLYEMRLTLQQRQADLQRLRTGHGSALGRQRARQASPGPPWPCATNSPPAGRPTASAWASSRAATSTCGPSATPRNSPGK